MAGERTIVDFSFLRQKLFRFVNVLPHVEVEGQPTLAVDPDELVYLRYQAPDESVWRQISVSTVLHADSVPPPGEYWARLYDPPVEGGPIAFEERTCISEIRAELRPLRAGDEQGGGPAFVRACGLSFELVKSASVEVRAENVRLAEQLRAAQDDNDRLRRERNERDAEILELKARIHELEENDSTLADLLPMVFEVLGGEGAPPGEPSTQLAEVPPQ